MVSFYYTYVCIYLCNFWYHNCKCDQSVASLSQPEWLADNIFSQRDKKTGYRAEDTKGLCLYGIVK